MTLPARIAWALIALALATWGGSWLVPSRPWLEVLRHALEGAFIGGICDWYAIRKFYSKIEKNHAALAAGVSKTVVGDMIQPEQVLSELQAQLSDPAFARDLAEQVASRIPDRGSLSHFLDEVWQESLREPVVTWLVELDPRAQLRSTRAPNVLDDDEVRSALRRALSTTAARQDLAEGLYGALVERYGTQVLWEPPLPGVSPVTLERILRRLVSPDDLVRLLRRTIERVLGDREAQAETSPPVVEPALVAYGEAYVETWRGWEEHERRTAAEALVDRLAPEIIDALAAVTWTQRELLTGLASENFSLDAHPLVEFLEEQIGQLVQEQLELIDQRSQELLTEKLTRLGAPELRVLLERRTRPHLDWIQVNGAVLGSMLGLLVGTGVWILRT